MYLKKSLFCLACIALLLCIGAYSVRLALRAQTTMPVLYIQLDEGEVLFEKEYSNATFSYSYPERMTVDDIEMTIRQRGNGTYASQKKSYKIKLDEEADLLFGATTSSANAATDWILLAEYFDRASLRNYTMFLMASHFESFGFSSQGMLVEVYLNDEYQGVYLLCEEVEVDEARLDIDDKAEENKGFLVELRTYQKQDYAVTIYHGEDKQVYDIRSNIDSQEDVDRIQTIIETANEAIMSGDQTAIAAAIDLESCVDMYILQEYLLNLDVGWASFYLWCEADEDILRFGPPWDFDHSMGSDVRLFEGWFEGIYVGDVDGEKVQQNLWYQDLMAQEWFQDLVRERWNEVKDELYAEIAAVQDVAAAYSEQLARDYQLWYVDLYIADSQATYLGSDYQDDANFLFYWLECRYVWLDDYFNNVM